MPTSSSSGEPRRGAGISITSSHCSYRVLCADSMAITGSGSAGEQGTREKDERDETDERLSGLHATKCRFVTQSSQTMRQLPKRGSKAPLLPLPMPAELLQGGSVGDLPKQTDRLYQSWDSNMGLLAPSTMLRPLGNSALLSDTRCDELILPRGEFGSIRIAQCRGREGGSSFSL